MRRGIMILSGTLMLIAMMGLLFFAGAVYDSEEKSAIDTFFFQLPPKAANRINAPKAASTVLESDLREMLIARFVNEYFYVVPDMDNANARNEFRNTDRTLSALGGLGSGKVREKWKSTEGREIIDLAARNVFRTVRIFPDITESESGHLVVRYELTTWNKPNDVLALPEVTTGTLYLDVTKSPIRVRQTAQTLEYLKSGIDPVSAFTFEVLDVIQN